MNELDKDPPPKETEVKNAAEQLPLPINSSSDDLTIAESDVPKGNLLKIVRNDVTEENVEDDNPDKNSDSKMNTEINSSQISSEHEENDKSSEKDTEKHSNPTTYSARPRQLVRGLALCGDDDTKLRQPPSVTMQKLSHSLSRDSSFTDHGDGAAVDLKAFIANTLHKNPRDRKTILSLEKELTEFIECSKERAYKFPPMSSYNRMLLHRIAAVFGLDHNVDNSGKCIVVNKTEKTTLPDYNFSSFITHNCYSDSKQITYDSQNEVPAVNFVEYDMFIRRALSYDTPNYVPNTGNWVHQPVNHSTEAIPSAIEGWGERALCMKKAGSFGGVPTYNRQGSFGSSVPYPHNGSGAQQSPRDPTEELADNLSTTQLDVRNLQPRHPGTSTPTEIRETPYDIPYQQRIYVPTTVVPRDQMYQPVANNLPSNVAVRPIPYPPQLPYNQWNPMPYMYAPNMVHQNMPMQTIQHQYQHTHPGPIIVHSPMQPQYSHYPMPHPIPQPQPARFDSPSFVNIPNSSSRSQQGMVASVDGGYGSMTQETCRDSELTQE